MAKMTNEELAREAADQINVLVASKQHSLTISGFRSTYEQIIRDTYAPSMAEYERALDLLECVKIESQNIVAGGPSYPITQPLRAAICHFLKDRPHNERTAT